MQNSIKHLLCTQLWAGCSVAGAPMEWPVSLALVMKLQALENLWGSKEASGLTSRGFGEQKRDRSHGMPRGFAEERTRRPTVGQNVSVAEGKG